MAEELYDHIEAVKDLMAEITTIVRKVEKGRPDSIVVTGSGYCQVAIFDTRIRQQNYGCQTNMETWRTPMRAYVPLGADKKRAEETLQKLWNLAVAKFIAHVSADDTCTRCELEMGRWGYRTVAGDRCRTLDMTLVAQNVREVAYA